MENSNVSSTGELIVEINYEQTEIPTVIREESSLLSTDALKLRKQQKKALIHLDRLVVQRLSEYFTVWKLKVLLGQQITFTDSVDDEKHQDIDSQLDFSLFHRQLSEEKENKKSALRTHVKVTQVAAGQDEEEKKVEQLQNFTFDLSLDGGDESESNALSDSMLLSGHAIFVNQAASQSPAVAIEENDQIDELYRELQELIGQRQDTENSKMLAESSMSEPISPYKPPESDDISIGMPAYNL